MFGSLAAVKDVSFRVESGSVFGLLGPNGAGKTTLISMLVTMKKPTSGSALVNRFDVQKNPDEVRRSIGIVFQDPSLDDELTAFENLELHAAMYGVPAAEREKRIADAVNTVELSERLHDVVKNFSGGMRRRLEIARGLLHFPKVLFLDEPTLGLDPQTRKHVWAYITRLNKEKGITVVLTTHYLDEADGVCDKIAIIDHGKIVASGTPGQLKNALGGDSIIVATSHPEKFSKMLKSCRWVSSTNFDGEYFTLRVGSGEKFIPKLVSAASRHCVPITSVSLRKPSLDDVFMHYTGRAIREEEASSKDAMRLRRRAWGRR